MSYSKPVCPKCSSEHIIKKGYFRTAWNRQHVPRYECKGCSVRFSASTLKDTYKQHKPFLNEQIYKLLCSGVTIRRTAKILGIGKNTVPRKATFVAKRAEKAHAEFLKVTKTGYVQFDEMETFEHTKMKPLSITVAVRAKTGEIIDLRVATMNCKGRLAPLSRAIYGPRDDTRKEACKSVLEVVATLARAAVTVVCDGKKVYPRLIRESMPTAEVRAMVKGRVNDALWRLNHVAAKLRADLTRLHRRTWSTTKKAYKLQEHLMLYIAWNNQYDLFG